MQTILADMRKVLAKNPQVEQKKLHRRVFLEDINPENQALMVGTFFCSLVYKIMSLQISHLVFFCLSSIYVLKGFFKAHL